MALVHLKTKLGLQSTSVPPIPITTSKLGGTPSRFGTFGGILKYQTTLANLTIPQKVGKSSIDSLVPDKTNIRTLKGLNRIINETIYGNITKTQPSGQIDALKAKPVILSKPVTAPTMDYSTMEKNAWAGDSRDTSEKMPLMHYSMGYNTGFDDGFVRGGVIGMAKRSFDDGERMAKFMLTSKGLLFLAHQNVLQLANPRKETRFFNPVTLLAQVVVTGFGGHLPRHGLNPFSTTGIDRPSYSSVGNAFTGGKNTDYAYEGGDNTKSTARLDKLTNSLLASSETSRRDAALAVNGESNILSKFLGSTPARSVNTQFTQDGESNHKRYGYGSKLQGQYRSLTYGELGVDDNRYIPMGGSQKTDLKGGTNGYIYDSTGLSTRRKSQISDRLEQRAGFPDYRQYTNDKKGKDRLNSATPKTVQDTDLGSYDTNKELTDIIPFYFYDVEETSLIPFRATITGLTDNITPDWASYNYVGNPNTYFRYRGSTRGISFSFKIATTNEYELKTNIVKLSRLVGLCYPSYEATSNRMISPFIKLTIGDMYYQIPGFIQSLGITVDDSTPWEINLFNLSHLAKVPHVFNCAIQFTYIGNESPVKDSAFFAYNKMSNNQPWNDDLTILKQKSMN